jgi:gluconate 2-dehydrogenase alpha chain
MKTLSPVDVVIVGGGWTGLLMAKEIGLRTPRSVVVLERGRQRNLADYVAGMDELDYAVRGRMYQDYSHETVTFRHSTDGKALPVRQIGSFKPGTGVGGAGEHWGGVCERMLPDAFEFLSRTTEKYGAKKLPEEHAILDWGITYDELEPYYSRAEVLLGASGKAGNIRGNKIEGGNVFEGWRSAEFPTPAMKIPYYSTVFRDAVKSLGYHPYPTSTATLSVPYTNPDGVSRAGCAYCGYCEGFGCMIGAKAQPSNTLLPVLERCKNVSLRTGTNVRRIEHKNGRATGVRYMDDNGEEILQPAELIVLASWVLNNTRLLLLSGVGEPYNPTTGQGTLGRNLSHQVGSSVRGFFEKPLNSFMGSGPTGIDISDLDGDIFDHTNLSFLGGGVVHGSSHGDRPIANFGATPPSVRTKWGSDWKKAALGLWDHTGSVSFEADHFPYRGHYMDLDSTYKDAYGDPLLRMTLDWRENERKMVEFSIPKMTEIIKAMGARDITRSEPLGRYDTRRYQSTHVNGGTIMGHSPEKSVVNNFLQHWDVPNLFVLGGSTHPHQSSAHPTLTILAITLRTADAIVGTYLKNPGSLA